MRCVRDSLTGACAHAHHAATKIVFVPVDGRTVFCICLLGIVMNVIWMTLWLKKGVRFEEDA